MDADTVVVGDGPAGLAAAAACAGLGLRVSLVGPDLDAPWPNTYGIWEDELAAAGLEGVLAARWPEVTVATGQAPRRTLTRPYGLIDNARLKGELRARAESGGVRLVAGRASGLEEGAAGPAVLLHGGAAVSARAVIDASGHRPVLLRSARSRRALAWQAAYGILATFSRPPIEPGSMVFMDYRDAPLHGLPAVAEDPTFLYAMDLGGGRFFVEETSLARRPALGFDVLAARLAHRLDAAGARVEETHGVERCRFPMGVPLPPRNQLAIGFGGAAGMVHPATGYQVGSALTRAPALAAALAAALDRPAATPWSVARAGWEAVWPERLIRQRALHRFGLEALLGLDTVMTQHFFSAFFALDEARWRGFVSGAPTLRSVAGTMLALWASVPGPVRRALTRPALGPAVADLVQAASAGWGRRSIAPQSPPP